MAEARAFTKRKPNAPNPGGDNKGRGAKQRKGKPIKSTAKSP